MAIDDQNYRIYPKQTEKYRESCFECNLDENDSCCLLNNKTVSVDTCIYYRNSSTKLSKKKVIPIEEDLYSTVLVGVKTLIANNYSPYTIEQACREITEALFRFYEIKRKEK
jgi:hypothetical protein